MQLFEFGRLGCIATVDWSDWTIGVKWQYERKFTLSACVGLWNIYVSPLPCLKLHFGYVTKYLPLADIGK